jgi:septum formation protein
MHPIILASQSPRRKQLLLWADIPFEVMVQDTNETYPPDLSITEIPVYIAKQKANAVKAKLQFQATIIAADTIVVANNTVLGKPKDKADALQILLQLNGNVHTVITGVVITKGLQEYSFAESTSVYFNTLTHQQLDYYVEKYKPYDKAGAYGIQEWIGVVGIQKIEGDFYNVMGLPINKVVQVLQQIKAI